MNAKQTSGTKRALPAWLVILGAICLILIWSTGMPLHAETEQEEFVILAYGDSLTAGWGLPAQAAFPVLLEKRLRADGLDVRVINAGVAGETSAAGLARLDWVLSGLEQDLGRMPDLAILELGANDSLRGDDPRAMEQNLAAILRQFKDRDVPVLLCGMYAMVNLGREYAEAYNAVFPRLAEQYAAGYVPFFLEGVALNPDLNQADGLHPNEAGMAVVVENVYPVLKELVLELMKE